MYKKRVKYPYLCVHCTIYPYTFMHHVYSPTLPLELGENIPHTQLVNNTRKLGATQPFGKSISKLVIYLDKYSADNASLQMIFYEMSIHLNMFGSIMLNRIVRYVDCHLSVRIQIH